MNAIRRSKVAVGDSSEIKARRAEEATDLPMQCEDLRLVTIESACF